MKLSLKRSAINESPIRETCELSIASLNSPFKKITDKQLNLDNIKLININNTNNNSLHKISQIIQNFNKLNILKEIEPTTQNINENFFEEDLSIVIDDLVDFNFKEVNEGKVERVRKQHVFDYINNHKLKLNEIYKWLLNNQNDSNSIYFLGYFNYHGIEVKVNKQRALEFYQKAANLGNIIAQHNLSSMYIDGEGVDKNYGKAFELSEKLAEKEYISGINMLGYCYYHGIGTDANMGKAFELYKKVADFGSSYGMFNLGYCYENGVGTSVDKNKAFELYQMAANLGDDFAQYNLALMYEKGNGTEKDMDKAIYWYKKSAEQGDEDALNKLKKLSCYL
ncbi:HCP-like protein [Rhizophagus irregularis]|nr:HCP-like protein [Rhizophagus irregularis]